MAKKALYESCTLGDLTIQSLMGPPERVAIIDGEQRISYGELRQSVASAIAVLSDMGIKSGDGIAVLSANRPEVIVVICAAYVLGLQYTPLSPLASEDDQLSMLEQAGVRCLIVDADRFNKRGAALHARTNVLATTLTLGPAAFGHDMLELLKCHDATELSSSAKVDDCAFLAFTGGTTGLPKAVVQRQSAGVAMHIMMLAAWEWPDDVRILLSTPLSHAAGAMILPTLMQGGAIVLMSGFDPKACLIEMARSRVTVTFMVPSMIYALLDCLESGTSSPKSLETIFYGAAPMRPDRLEQGIGLLGPVFMQLYGQTEAPLCITVLRRGDHDLSRPEVLASCGRTVPGMQIALFDEVGRTVDSGEAGEICVRGPLVMDRYLHHAEETAEAFKFDWLHTGDIGRFDSNGYLYIIDRKKDMIITGGINVYPSELERILIEHEAVNQCCVVGLPDDKWGEAVTAAIIFEGGQAVTLEELNRYVRLIKGDAYSLKSIHVVDSLPLTGLGKPDKRALVSMLRGAR